jgi:predicted exporter
MIPWLLGDRVLEFPRLRVPAGAAIADSPWPRLLALAATFGAIGWLGATQPDWWERDLANISPVPAAMRAEDVSLRREMGAPEMGVLLASRGASEDEAIEAAEAMLPALERWQSEGLLRGYDSPARTLPSRKMQASRRAALPEGPLLEASLREAQKGLAFRADAFAPFLKEASAAREAPPLTRVAYAGTPLGTKLAAQVVELDGHWLVLTSLGGIADMARLRAAVAAHPDARTQIVDLKQASADMLEGFRGEALRQASLGALLIVVLLAFGLGSFGRTARVTAPVAAALPITVAVLVAAGQKIGIFHMVALLLVLGIGLNYALFFERPPADEAEAERTRLALALCSTSTVITFGCLALSSTPVLRAIGATVAIGAMLSLALAALWARRRA